jgi:hypothetical protein
VTIFDHDGAPVLEVQEPLAGSDLSVLERLPGQGLDEIQPAERDFTGLNQPNGPREIRKLAIRLVRPGLFQAEGFVLWAAPFTEPS